MNLKLKDKVAVVTGASKGIGAGIAKAFAKEGAKVVVNYASSKEGAEKVINEIIGAGGTAVAIQADVTKTAEVKRLFDEVKTNYGQLDILVNNAGIYQFTPLDGVTEDSFHAQFNTNVLGTILTIQKAVELFGENGGSVINISSTVSLNPFPALLEYAATKAAVDNITKTLAKKLGAKKIRVNTIAPGITDTEGAIAAGLIGSDMETQMVSGTPLGRVGRPEDMAKVAVFLASEDSAWVTGERITVAGGLL